MRGYFEVYLANLCVTSANDCADECTASMRGHWWFRERLSVSYLCPGLIVHSTL